MRTAPHPVLTGLLSGHEKQQSRMPVEAESVSEERWPDGMETGGDRSVSGGPRTPLSSARPATIRTAVWTKG